ncbi:MAG: hypothetical protein R6V20_10680 [Desulfobia sp.]
MTPLYHRLYRLRCLRVICQADAGYSRRHLPVRLFIARKIWAQEADRGVRHSALFKLGVTHMGATSKTSGRLHPARSHHL